VSWATEHGTGAQALVDFRWSAWPNRWLVTLPTSARDGPQVIPPGSPAAIIAGDEPKHLATIYCSSAVLCAAHMVEASLWFASSLSARGISGAMAVGPRPITTPARVRCWGLHRASRADYAQFGEKGRLQLLLARPNDTRETASSRV